MSILNEDKRQQLIAKSKSSEKGNQRFKRRVKSKVARNVKNFNSINMNKLFKQDILDIGIQVHGETDDYIVTISFGGFLEILRKNLKSNNNHLDLRIIIRTLMQSFNDENVYIKCTCLHPDTKIKLLDGTTLPVSEMKTLFDQGEKLFVYSVDSNGDFKPGEVEKVWITDTVDNFIKIVLDNDEEIITTPDHLYMLRDGSYCQAQNLVEGQSLIPLNHKVKSIEYISIPGTPVYDIKVKEYQNFLVDAGVILHNCPDWKYRFAYFANINKITLDPLENRPSNITNPEDTLGSACKHVLLVLSNNSWIIKVASVINNYIKYMETHMEHLYASIIYPALYGQEYDKEYQMSLDQDDTLADDEETIDTANIEGRKRGQFKAGNPYRFKPYKDKEESEDQIALSDIDDDIE